MHGVSQCSNTLSCQSVGLQGVPQDVESVCTPSRNKPREFFDMEDMEDTEVHGDDSTEDMEGKQRTTMASPARTEAETNRPQVS
jgi:hypothetical protein